MSDLSIFRFDGADVRTVVIDGEPWFVAKDACDVLGISQHRDAVAQLDEDERASAAVDTLGGRQSMTVVNEAGVYALLLISRSPRARAFQRWLAHDVVPSIRRTGSFVVPETPEQQIARALVTAAGIIERKDEHIAALIDLLDIHFGERDASVRLADGTALAWLPADDMAILSTPAKDGRGVWDIVLARPARAARA